MARLVMCAKLRHELPGLERPPVGGELGQRIFNEISQEAWRMWQQHAVLLMNHYGLNMADPDTRKALMQEMNDFFFGEDARMPEGWVPEGTGGEAPARGGKGGGAPAGKGGGRRK